MRFRGYNTLHELTGVGVIDISYFCKNLFQALCSKRAGRSSAASDFLTRRTDEVWMLQIALNPIAEESGALHRSVT